MGAVIRIWMPPFACDSPLLRFSFHRSVYHIYVISMFMLTATIMSKLFSLAPLIELPYCTLYLYHLVTIILLT